MDNNVEVRTVEMLREVFSPEKVLEYTIALDRDKLYTVLSIERGWYRIMTELDEDYLFPPDLFEIVYEKKESLTETKTE